MTIGERIKQKRIELNLSQDELAKRVGYKSRSSIQKIESARKLPITKVAIMASALNCSPGYLMGWEDDEGNKIESHSEFELSPEDKQFIELFHNANPDRRKLALDVLKVQ